jgi:hypothetical protein
MIGSKGDLKQGILGALTAGFNAKAKKVKLTGGVIGHYE